MRVGGSTTGQIARNRLLEAQSADEHGPLLLGTAMKFDNPEILLSCHLLDRVAAAVGGLRKVVFLLGSGATMPHGRSPGVRQVKVL
jgi:hypothetical protein